MSARKPHPRGTSNSNSRGNSAARRARREYLVMTYRANVDLLLVVDNYGTTTEIEVPLGQGEAACRCYRCGDLLVADDVSVDRIVEGDRGGTYARNNIRPACGFDNSSTGSAYRWTKARAKAAKIAARRLTIVPATA